VKAAIPTDFPMLAAPWLMSGLASLYGRSRLANVLPPLANVVISNVPGVQRECESWARFLAEGNERSISAWRMWERGALP
jgi:hypothetical protein